MTCWETCSTDCESAGNIRGGLCDSAGTCTCLTGQKKMFAKKDEVSCWETCSTDCESAGSIRGGTCDSAGACTCFSRY